MRTVAWLCVVLGIGILLGGCSSGVSRDDIERRVVARAPDLIGPGDRYLVKLGTIDGEEIDQITITGLGVQADPNLVCDPLILTLHHVKFQTAPFHVVQIGGATFEARVSESAVNYYIMHQNRTTTGNMKDMRVTFEHGVVKVSATAGVGRIDVPIATSGFLRIVDGLRFHYISEKHQVLGVSLGLPGTAQVMNALLDKVNPMVDLSGLRFTPNVTHLSIEPGAITFTGQATLRTLE